MLDEEAIVTGDCPVSGGGVWRVSWLARVLLAVRGSYGGGWEDVGALATLLGGTKSNRTVLTTYLSLRLIF